MHYSPQNGPKTPFSGLESFSGLAWLQRWKNSTVQALDDSVLFDAA